MNTFVNLCDLWWKLFTARVNHNRYEKKESDELLWYVFSCWFLAVIFLVVPKAKNIAPKYYNLVEDKEN